MGIGLVGMGNLHRIQGRKGLVSAHCVSRLQKVEVLLWLQRAFMKHAQREHLQHSDGANAILMQYGTAAHEASEASEVQEKTGPEDEVSVDLRRTRSSATGACTLLGR